MYIVFWSYRTRRLKYKDVRRLRTCLELVKHIACYVLFSEVTRLSKIVFHAKYYIALYYEIYR